MRACLPPGDPALEYPFPVAATRLTSLTVGYEQDGLTCCADLNGDGDPDNLLGMLMDQLSEQQSALTEHLEEGTLKLALAYPGAAPGRSGCRAWRSILALPPRGLTLLAWPAHIRRRRRGG